MTTQSLPVRGGQSKRDSVRRSAWRCGSEVAMRALGGPRVRNTSLSIVSVATENGEKAAEFGEKADFAESDLRVVVGATS